MKENILIALAIVIIASMWIQFSTQNANAIQSNYRKQYDDNLT